VIILSRLCKVVLKNNKESPLQKNYLSENSFLRNCYILTHKKLFFRLSRLPCRLKLLVLRKSWFEVEGFKGVINGDLCVKTVLFMTRSEGCYRQVCIEITPL